MIFFSFKADLKARMECNFFFKRYYKCKQCCDRCNAVAPTTNQPDPLSYKDFSPQAAYTRTLVTHEQYMRSTPPALISPWAAVGGWQLESVGFDWMHLVYLGVAKDLVPSALRLLNILGYGYEPGETDAKFLQRATMEMRESCKNKGFFRSNANFRDFVFCPVLFIHVYTFCSMTILCLMGFAQCVSGFMCRGVS